MLTLVIQSDNNLDTNYRLHQKYTIQSTRETYLYHMAKGATEKDMTRNIY